MSLISHHEMRTGCFSCMTAWLRGERGTCGADSFLHFSASPLRIRGSPKWLLAGGTHAWIQLAGDMQAAARVNISASAGHSGLSNTVLLESGRVWPIPCHRHVLQALPGSCPPLSRHVAPFRDLIAERRPMADNDEPPARDTSPHSQASQQVAWLTECPVRESKIHSM